MKKMRGRRRGRGRGGNLGKGGIDLKANDTKRIKHSRVTDDYLTFTL